MLIYYIAPSEIPSISANSIHVINMCDGFIKNKCNVKLFFRSNLKKNENIKKYIKKSYGIEKPLPKLVFYNSRVRKGEELIISLLAIFQLIKGRLFGEKPKLILSRNLFGSFLIGIFFKENIIYETHTLETGYRRIIQNIILKYSCCSVIVISNALRTILEENFNINIPIYVLHDAAKDGSKFFSLRKKNIYKKKLFKKMKNISKYKYLIGYFGHLYSGRGLEIILKTSKLKSDCAFVIIGGNKNDIDKNKKKFKSKNLFFFGHIQSHKVNNFMKCMDILLMPYQEKVSIGIKNIDTSKWMSPLKMFEYMSTGVPIISSNLPVLREVLKNKENAILIEPNDHMKWVETINLINNNACIRKKITLNAYNDYKEKYNWTYRSKRIISISKNN